MNEIETLLLTIQHVVSLLDNLEKRVTRIELNMKKLEKKIEDSKDPFYPLNLPSRS